VLKEALKLHTPNIDLYIPPKDKNTWLRFRNCTSAFYEAVTDPVITMQSNAELLISQSELRLYLAELEKELNEHKSYKERFEALEKA